MITLKIPRYCKRLGWIVVLFPAVIHGQTHSTIQTNQISTSQQTDIVSKAQETISTPDTQDAQAAEDVEDKQTETDPDLKDEKPELPPETPEASQAVVCHPDPLECINRASYGFNKLLDRVILRPIAVTYVILIPGPVQMMVRNVFQNLSEISNIINDLLQGDFCHATNDAARLIINSTWGIAGLFDPASKGGLETHIQDFGITMARSCCHTNSIYLVVPLFGPSTLRDSVGRVVTYFMTPQAYLGSYCFGHHHIRSAWAWQLGLIVLKNIDSRGALLKVEPIISDAVDEYTLVKDAYYQNRQYEISGGCAVISTQKEALAGPPE